MRIVLKGIGASRGMTLGRARLVQPSQFLVDETRLEPNEIDAEATRLEGALETARAELKVIRAKLHGALAREIGEFIDAHSLLLSDPELVSGLFDLVRRGRYRASAALKMQRDRLAAVFEAMDDPYLRSRREDIDHVIGRVQAALSRETSPAERQIAARVGTILVSDQIAPAEMTHLAEQGVLGTVCTGSSPLSHSAILSRSMRLPMVVGAHDALAQIHDDDLVMIDGEHGEVVVHPTAQDLARYRQHARDMQREGQRLAQLAHAQTLTACGTSMRLYANAELPAEVAQARAHGAAGIGLYRTEFLFLQRHHLPDEDEQFHAYRDLVLGMGGLPVTVRTLDLGADKADTTGLALTREPNPALGMRGVRLSIRRPALFATQMRAILRASAYGPIRVLVPMVSRAEEIRATRRLMEICARDLRSEGHEIADHFELGAMVEVPAAAIAPRRFRLDRHERPRAVHARGRPQQRRGVGPLRPAASGGAQTALRHDPLRRKGRQAGLPVRRDGLGHDVHAAARRARPDRFQHAFGRDPRSARRARALRPYAPAPARPAPAQGRKPRRDRRAARRREPGELAQSRVVVKRRAEPQRSCGIIAPQTGDDRRHARPHRCRPRG
jgi:phosphotransferase system enzyme I (PtsI)